MSASNQPSSPGTLGPGRAGKALPLHLEMKTPRAWGGAWWVTGTQVTWLTALGSSAGTEHKAQCSQLTGHSTQHSQDATVSWHL